MTAETVPPEWATESDLAAARADIANLQTALETRHLIGLAQGLLMARFRLSERQSFRYLVRRSNETNTKLREIAAQTVGEWDRDHG
jgi:AmiR/NasT family two-component response regulator